jgi:hypothetical protein
MAWNGRQKSQTETFVALQFAFSACQPSDKSEAQENENTTLDCNLNGAKKRQNLEEYHL